MTRAQKEKLVAKYMTKDIPALTEYQKEWIRKETAHYIFVDRDDNGKHVCHCDRCDKDIDIAKTKHKAKAICPTCGNELEVLHTWRNSNKETIDWLVVPKALDEYTLMLRYVYAHRRGKWCDIAEAARIVFDTRQKTIHYFEYGVDIIDGNYENRWMYTRVHYFTEFNMYNYRHWCCLPAKPYKPTWRRELKKLSCFKYFPQYKEFENYHYYVHDDIKNISYKAPLYEKLSKVGFQQFIDDDFHARNRIDYNTNETSLLKMLGINKTQYKIFANNQTVNAFNYIRLIPDIDQPLLNYLLSLKFTHNDVKSIVKRKLNLRKTAKYIMRINGLHSAEWLHYVTMLEYLEYPLDEHYLYPKDFRKEDDRVTKEYYEKKRIEREKADEEKRKRIEAEDKKNDELIRNISNALRANEEIKEFFAGCNGLQVFVPDSADELKNEGIALHNCLGTYVNRYAKGNTLIFFVHKIDDPTAPYVAMEYCHGRIIQCRYDYNQPVTDTKVIDFTEALAARLRKLNILAA